MRRAAFIRFFALPVALVAVAACGGENPRPEPDLRPALGEKLAAHADAVAASLEAGDACGAKERAVALQRDVAAAIEAGRVPAELRRELRRTATRVVAQIQCVPADPPPDEGDQGDEGEAGDEGDEGDEGASSCEALESRKAEIDAEKEALKETVEDEQERKEREKELEEEKKAIEKELKACGEGG